MREAGLLQADTGSSGIRLLRQGLQLALGTLALAIQHTQLAYATADRLLGLTQFIGRFLAVCLRFVELLLECIEALLERFQFGLCAVDLICAGAHWPAQRQ
ncbi:MAG: hypothetical protein Q8K62_03250 [Thiobacillus sp.]|nr:hypothetical protein [Thiobacillus sp.]